MLNLRDGHLGDSLWVINDKRDELHDVPCVPSLAALPERVDCLAIAVPATGVLPIVEEALNLQRARSVVIFSSGIGEVGDEGKRVEARLGQLAASARVPIFGPNTLGLFNFVDSTVISFMSDVDPSVTSPGRIGVVSQSGGLGTGLARSR